MSAAVSWIAPHLNVHFRSLPTDSGQLTVRSADGFTATYVVDTSTKVGKNRKASDIGQVAANDQVTILATKTGGTTTATRISDTGPVR